ncbi:MAG: DUF5050 domain-containing protein [Clostridia bacterium]|nr:DUF5050 domain-containing protein [Clostridia bacterium]
MRTDINNLIDSIAREQVNGEGEKEALKELYDEYRVPFYFIALLMLQDEKKARNVAAEAFRRLSVLSYKFDENLNAEYWFYDVLYTLCANAAGVDVDKKTAGIPNVPHDLVQEPEVYIKLYSDLDINSIASIVEKRKSNIKSVLKNEDRCKIIKNIAPQYCPDFWDIVMGEKETGYEDFSEKERIRTETQDIQKKRTNSVKRILAIVLIVTFVCSAIMTAVLLLSKKFGSDVDKNEVSEDIVLQFDNSIAVAEMDDSIYFCKDDSLWKYDTKEGKNEKISDDNPKELLSDGKYIYYRNHKDGYMYRIDANGQNKISLCDKPGASMALYEDKIYFSTGEAIYSIPSSGGKLTEAQLLLDISTDDNLYCVDTAVDSKGNVFFAGGIGKGIHHITTFKNEPSLEGIFADEVYVLKIDGDKLFFDYKEANGKIFLYKFDITKYLTAEENKRVLPEVVYDASDEKVSLATGAFDVTNGKIFFAGEKNDMSVLFFIDEEGNRKKLTEIPADYAATRKNLVISDIHVFEKKVYYFCSDGKSGGNRAFFEYDMNTNKTCKIF